MTALSFCLLTWTAASGSTPTEPASGPLSPTHGGSRPERSLPAVIRGHAMALIMYTKVAFLFSQVSLANECDSPAARMETRFTRFENKLYGASGSWERVEASFKLGGEENAELKTHRDAKASWTPPMHTFCSYKSLRGS